MVATLDDPFMCPRCGITRYARVDMKNHIQSTHARNHREDDCELCRQPNAPSHDASYRCESGWYSHCSCDTCY